MTIIWATGDGATGGTDSAKVAAMIAADKPDAFLWLGDVYESGTQAEFQQNYNPSWGVKELYDKTYPIPGNHDWPNRQQGFYPYFAPRGLFSADQSWYATSFGDWIFLMLNSEESVEEGSPQYQWAQSMINPADIAANARKRIACWHRPRYCSGSHGDALDLNPLWQLVAPHCIVVLSGHAHNMQQFKPDPTGCVQIVSGASGRSLYAEVPNDPRLQWGKADGYGAVRLELGEALGIKWVDENGNALWEGTLAL